MVCTCICPENLSAEHEGLSSMRKDKKGHPFPTIALPHMALPQQMFKFFFFFFFYLHLRTCLLIFGESGEERERERE